MDQAKVAIDGTMASELFGGLPRRITLPSSPAWIAGLSVAVALPVLLLVVAELVGSPAVPQQLKGAAPPPAGTWNCALPGETLGMLTVEGWRYALTIDGAQPRVGTLAPVGGQGFKNKAAYVRVESGPLKDEFGLGLGIHLDVVEPDNLIFNKEPGAGVRCVRT
jgi:hypothetical protein